jgi:hypothetical protein
VEVEEMPRKIACMNKCPLQKKSKFHLQPLHDVVVFIFKFILVIFQDRL